MYLAAAQLHPEPGYMSEEQQEKIQKLFWFRPDMSSGLSLVENGGLWVVERGKYGGMADRADIICVSLPPLSGTVTAHKCVSQLLNINFST